MKDVWYWVTAATGLSSYWVRYDRHELTSSLGHFVHEVARIKNLLVHEDPHGQPAGAKLSFSPEFKGSRHHVTHPIETEARHGEVISVLHDRVEALGHRCFNDGQRDLFIQAPLSRRITHLFEAKTNVSTTSVYEAVGQLMLHAAAEPHQPRRILVIPEHPKHKTADALNRLGIHVTTYRWKKKKPLFSDLPGAIGGHS